MRVHNTSSDAHTSPSGMRRLLYVHPYLLLFQEIQAEDGGVRGHRVPEPNQDPSSPHFPPHGTQLDREPWADLAVPPLEGARPG